MVGYKTHKRLDQLKLSGLKEYAGEIGMKNYKSVKKSDLLTKIKEFTTGDHIKYEEGRTLIIRLIRAWTL